MYDSGFAMRNMSDSTFSWDPRLRTWLKSMPMIRACSLGQSVYYFAMDGKVIIPDSRDEVLLVQQIQIKANS